MPVCVADRPDLARQPLDLGQIDGIVERILVEHEDPEAACDALVAAANDAGGPDNITVVVLRNDA